MARTKGDKAQSKAGRGRLKGTIIGVLSIMALLGVRLVYLQGIHASVLAAEASDQRTHVENLAAERGDIVDRNGVVLASNKAAASIYAYPDQVKNPQETAHALAPLLGRPEKVVYAALTGGAKFAWLQRKLEMPTVNKIMALKLPGIYQAEERKRYYPQGLAAQILGFVGEEHTGQAGLEYTYDKQLMGQPGKIVAEYTPLGELIAGGVQQVIPSQPGLTLQLTINAQIQQLAEQALKKALVDKKAKRGLIAVEDPRTGEILALAMAPTWDPNTYMDIKATEAQMRDWAVQDALFPGSIFKPITAAMAQEEHLLTPTSLIPDHGILRFEKGLPITNFEPGDNGEITLGQALAISSNVAMGQVSLKVGTGTFYRYLHAFNLDRPTGVDLPGEAGPIIDDPKTLQPRDQALMGIGQSISVSPMQILAAEAAIANNGVWIRPHLLKGWQTPDGKPGSAVAPAETRQIISKETAQEVRDEMKQVLEVTPRFTGTGTLAQVPGYTIAGKTGTAEKLDGGKVSTTKYLASFMGFVPADHPQVVTLVMLDEPQYKDGLSGFNSAPVWGEFMPEVLQILGIRPDQPTQITSPPTPKVEACKVPKLVGMASVNATTAAHNAGYRLAIQGPGDKVTGQAVAPDAELPCRSTVTVRADSPPPAITGISTRVPDIWQMPYTDAATALSAAGFTPDITGSGLAVSQDPPPGGYAIKGNVVHVGLVQPGG